MPFIYTIVVLIAIFGILAIIYIVNFNKLNSKKIRIDEAEFVIDETLRLRYDLIIRVSNIIKTNIDINADYFKEFETLKSKKISNFDLNRKITEAINLVLQLKEDYKELEENIGMQDVMIELKETEEKLEAAIAFYNKYTTDLNLIIKKFPSNIVAKMHHFKAKTFFDGKNLDDEITNDFKL